MVMKVSREKAYRLKNKEPMREQRDENERRKK